MIDKVFHASEETHRMVREYCDRHRLELKRWVADALAYAIRQQYGVGDVNEMVIPSVKIREVEIPTKVVVPKTKALAGGKRRLKNTPKLMTEAEMNEIWQRPPFWVQTATHAIQETNAHVVVDREDEADKEAKTRKAIQGIVDKLDVEPALKQMARNEARRMEADESDRQDEADKG